MLFKTENLIHISSLTCLNLKMINISHPVDKMHILKPFPFLLRYRKHFKPKVVCISDKVIVTVQSKSCRAL